MKMKFRPSSSSISMPFMRLLLMGVSVFVLSAQLAKAQLPQNLVYANENLRFDKLFSLGEYKMLYAVDYRKQRNRFAYLLDESNLIIDTMKVDGNDYIMPRSDSSLSISSLGDYYEITVRNGQFEADLVMNKAYDFGQKHMNFFHRLGKYFIGTRYHADEDCISYHYLSVDSLEAPVAVYKRSPGYGINDSSRSFFVFEKDYEKITGKNYESLPVEPLFDKEKSCEEKTRRPYYGWAEASLNNGQFTFFQRGTAKIFMVGVSGVPGLTAEFQLPLDKSDTQGWKYLFDTKTKKHYASRRIEIESDQPVTRKKRKRRDQPKNYGYELYALQQTGASFNLKPLYKLSFDPIMIDNDLVYEIVQESKKGSAIYFHPLDPDYVYEKSTLIYSKGR